MKTRNQKPEKGKKKSEDRSDIGGRAGFLVFGFWFLVFGFWFLKDKKMNMSEELKEALARVSAPPGFTERAIARVKFSGRRPTLSLRGLRQIAAAIVLVTLASLAGFRYVEQQREREAAQATQQLLTALKITAEKADVARREALASTHALRTVHYLSACVLQAGARERLDDRPGALASLLTCKATLEREIDKEAGEPLTLILNEMAQRWGQAGLDEALTAYRAQVRAEKGPS